MVVSLFDSKINTPITDTEVTANVAELTTAGEEKKMETMTIGNAVSYGNCFTIPGIKRKAKEKGQAYTL